MQHRKSGPHPGLHSGEVARIVRARMIEGLQRVRGSGGGLQRRDDGARAGCVNDWGPLGTGAGVVAPTCEAKATCTAWDKQAAALDAARDIVVTAADRPLDRTDPMVEDGFVRSVRESACAAVAQSSSARTSKQRMPCALCGDPITRRRIAGPGQGRARLWR